MTLVLDAGAFLAVEAGNREVVALIKHARLAGECPISHGAVIAQVWRGGAGRQAPLAHLIAGVDVRAVDEPLGRRGGMLLARSRTSDAIDALLVTVARDGDEILTSDPGDLRVLAEAAGLHVDIIPLTGK